MAEEVIQRDAELAAANYILGKLQLLRIIVIVHFWLIEFYHFGHECRVKNRNYE